MNPPRTPALTVAPMLVLVTVTGCEAGHGRRKKVGET